MLKKILFVLIYVVQISTYAQVQNNHSHNHEHHEIIDKTIYYEKFIGKLNFENKLKTFLGASNISTEDFLNINNYYIDIFFRVNFDEVLLYLDDKNKDVLVVSLINFLNKNELELLYETSEVVKEDRYYLAKNIFVPTAQNVEQSTQSFCDNLSFSSLNFSNWNTFCALTTGTIGMLSSITPYFPPALCNNRLQHSIVTSGNDALIPSIPRTFPGGNGISALLGDGTGVNARASLIRRTFLVTAENSKLIYRYAVVLQNPDHTNNEQPFFRTRLQKQDGTYDACANYLSFAGDGLPGWNLITIANKDYTYRNWTTVLVPLTSYIGQNVTIEISVADCDPGAHFGYAYLSFDACSNNDNLQLTCENNIYKLKAPDGGLSYLWNTGQTTPTINLTTPGIYTCTILPFGAAPSCTLTYSYNYQPIQYTLSNQTSFCKSATNSLSVNITGGIYPMLLNYSVNGGSPVQQIVTSSPAQIPIDSNLSGPINYSVVVGQNTNTILCSVPVLTTVNLIDVTAPTGNQFQTFCNGALISDIVVSGNAVNWYTSLTGGTPLSLNTLLVDGIYYASQTNSGCESFDRLPITITINNPAIPVGQNNQSFCYSATISDLVVSGSAIQWYLTPSGGSPLTSTFSLSTNTNYYASQTQNGCEGSSRLPILVTITNPLAPSGQGIQQFCYSATLSDLVLSGSNIQWYLAPTGGIALSSNYSLTNNSIYYASQTISGCESINRFPVTVNINNPLAPSGQGAQQFCFSALISDLVVAGNAIQWYLTPNGGMPLAINFSLSTNTTYYASQSINGCESINRFPVNVIITNPSIPSGQNTQEFCYSALISDLVVVGNAIQWYLTPSGGTPLANNYNLNDTTIYYASQTINGCESINRFPVNVVITNPSAPSGQNVQYFCNSATVADLVVFGNNIQWYLTPVGGNSLSTGYSLSNDTTYYASQTINGCKSISRFPVEVKLIIPVVPDGEPIQFFCIENNSTLKDIALSFNYELSFFDAPVNGNLLPLIYLLVNEEIVYAASFNSTYNCESIGRFPIKIKIRNSDLKYYNLITIDNNELNSKLSISGIEQFPENSIKIFNRYGNLIWEGVNYNNIDNPFKGISNVGGVISKESFLPSGTYFFILSYPNECKNSEIKGFIHLDNKL
ncbi:MAG: gliding motility-associated C-terminal domain-containing protein [Crocinitomicaceae bacterium]|nr:gliding motility-associated C-terminal domain-containing protein [Crocinitomicaceae bacterium]